MQVKTVAVTTTQSETTGSPTFSDISGLTVDITPAATGNKIFILANLNVSNYPNYGIATRMMRDTTALNICTDTSGVITMATWGVTEEALHKGMTNVNMMFLDAPSSTSATTYKCQWTVETNGTCYLNRYYTEQNYVYDYRGASTLTVMEVASGAL